MNDLYYFFRIFDQLQFRRNFVYASFSKLSLLTFQKDISRLVQLNKFLFCFTGWPHAIFARHCIYIYIHIYIRMCVRERMCARGCVYINKIYVYRMGVNGCS